MLQQITIIAFDLDDTLWPCMPTIDRAEQQLYSWLQRHCPRITERHDPDSMVRLRKQFMQQDARFAIDLSLMRCEFLRLLASEAGYDTEFVSQQGFEVFYQARQEVSFYADVLPCLQRLSARYRLGAITNGNANVEKVGLGELIEHSVSASELKIAKPDRQIFEHLTERFGASPQQMLYVGDDPIYDVVGPRDAGIEAVWMNREAKIWPEHLTRPSYQVTDLHQLEALLAR